MQKRKMFVCEKCKRELSGGMIFKPMPGAVTERGECEFCHKKVYGEYSIAEYKKNK